ncbi:MAG: class I SAM-dependent methyltransferase [Deltaproteobacteria bacterium]|nr:class I SAM-dependent methyltransferase [Deltaproteobacteria bacterium]
MGCGTGLAVSIAAERGCQAIGTDISPQAIRTAEERYPHIEFVEANGEDLPFADNSFDYVTALGSLEHYLIPEIGLREILRVARPDAKICIVLPNRYFLFNILAVTFTGDHHFGQWQIQERLETKKGWIRFLSENGFIIEKIKQDRFYGSFPIFESPNPWKIFKRLIRRLLSWLTPKNLAYQFIFIGRSDKK